MSEAEKIEQSVLAVKDLLMESKESNLFLDGQLYAIETVLRIIKRHRGVINEESKK